jgi:hypothetical protein
MQSIDPFKPLLSVRSGKLPMMINLYTTHTSYVSEGVPTVQSHKPEQYVLVSDLPAELRQRVLLAVEALTQGF